MLLLFSCQIITTEFNGVFMSVCSHDGAYGSFSVSSQHLLTSFLREAGSETHL